MANPLRFALGLAMVATGVSFILFRDRIDRYHAGHVESKVLERINAMLGGQADKPAAFGSYLVLGIGWIVVGLLGVFISFFS